MGFDEHTILDRVLIFLLVLLSLSVHECAHAWAAWRLGDDTARLMGRLTLNPLAHIDPVGTVLLPLLGVPFGWAKPVPVNPLRFTRRVSMRTGMLLVAVAGPLSNVAIALLSTVVLGLAWRFYPNLPKARQPGLFDLLDQLALINVVLAVFNLFPVPPLDGSRVADALMPRPGGRYGTGSAAWFHAAGGGDCASHVSGHRPVGPGRFGHCWSPAWSGLAGKLLWLTDGMNSAATPNRQLKHT